MEMDNNREFDDLRCYLRNLDTSAASKILSNSGFVSKHTGEIIHLLGEGLTEENCEHKPDYFNFCEEQLLKIARSEDYQEVIVDFLELLDMDSCKLSSTVLATVTLLENTESPNLTFLEYFLYSTFNSLNKLDKTRLKEILMNIVQNLSKLNKHFQHQRSVMHYFARVAFLLLRADIDPIEYVSVLANIINDPFYLLEIEFEKMEEKLYMASFFYLYFKTEMSWGPKVYDHFYVLEKCSKLALSVFQNDDFGKYFVKLILTKFKDNEIPLHLLNACHQEFCMEAAQSSWCHERKDIRKISIDSLIIFINKLTIDAQYITFKHLFSSPIDSSVKSELIITMKNLIVSRMHSNQDLGHFQGTRLMEIIRLCCSIPDGPECHVIEHQPFVMASITLVFGMHAFLTAEHHSDFSKMLNMGTEFYEYGKELVDVVQRAVDYTTEQCKLEHKKLEKKLDNRVVSVCNEDIPKLSEKEKQETLWHYNTNLRLIQEHLDMLKVRLGLGETNN